MDPRLTSDIAATAKDYSSKDLNTCDYRDEEDEDDKDKDGDTYDCIGASHQYSRDRGHIVPARM